MKLTQRGPKGIWTARFQVRGKRFVRSTYTEDHRLAVQRARQMVDEERAKAYGFVASVRADPTFVRPPRPERKVATFADVVAAYMRARPGEPPALTTRRMNVRALARLVEGAGLVTADDTSWSMDVLTAEAVELYQRALITRAQSVAMNDGGDVGDAIARAKRNANGVLNMARSVFARMEDFRSLLMPDLDGFMRGRRLVLQEHERPERFQPWSPAECEAVERAMVERRDAGEVGLWLTYRLMLCCGLRNEEVQFCKREWFRARADGVVEVHVVRWPYYHPKATLGAVPVPGCLVEEIETYGGQEWVIGDVSERARRDITHRRIGEVIAAAAPTRRAYDLRKMAGSRFYQRTKDLAATARFLRHRSTKTTEQWYLGLIDPLMPL